MRPGAALVLLVLVACAPPARVRYEEALAQTPPPAAHAVHAERLVEVMRGLDRLTGSRLPQAMDEDWERERRAAEVAAVASEIAASARLIPIPADLDASERRNFTTHVEALEEAATSLAEGAGSLTTEALDVRVSILRSVCDSCHRRFRVPQAGP